MSQQLLNYVLELFQTTHDDQKTRQIIGSTVHLLTTLTNPHNITLLTSQLLVAPAIWHHPKAGLVPCQHVLSIFHTAATRLRAAAIDPTSATISSLAKDHDHQGIPKHEFQSLKEAARQIPWPKPLSLDEWATAVLKGADHRSSRWQHVLVITGLLMGLEGLDGRDRSLSYAMRRTVEAALVTAANLALARPHQDGPLGADAMVLAFNFSYSILSHHHQNEVNTSGLLALLVPAITGASGFHGAVDIARISHDLHTVNKTQLSWSPTSPSFVALQATQQTAPLIRQMGGVSKLAINLFDRSPPPDTLLQAQRQLLAFTQQLSRAWESLVCSDLEPTMEDAVLTEETKDKTWPILWSYLQRVLYTSVTLCQAMMSRLLVDPTMRRNDTFVATVSVNTLKILRHLYFISSRPGNSAFQVYSFVFLSAIDLLSRYPKPLTDFLTEIQPTQTSRVPSRALARLYDLYYLNLAEHFPLSLTASSCEQLIVPIASLYVSFSPPSPTPLMKELLEAAHSAILAMLSCPQNNQLALKIVPFYLEHLFAAFPRLISPRQFRLAFKTMMQIVSPPYSVAATHPELAETLLEMVHHRALHAPQTILAQGPGHETDQNQEDQQDQRQRRDQDQEAQPPQNQEHSSSTGQDSAGQGQVYSEQTTLVLSLLDALPFVSPSIFEEWLTIATEAVASITDTRLREPALARLWHLLESGEMDAERSPVAVAWWCERGGRQLFMAAKRGAQTVSRL